MGLQRENDEPLGLTPLLEERFSTRVFDPEHEVTDDELRSVLTAAQWSPSAGNSQPWAFIVGRRGDQTHSAFVETLSRGNSWWAPRASALLIGVYQSGADATAEGRDMPYSDYAAYDLGQSVAHLTVQAMSLGLHVHQFAGFDHERAAEIFRVPPHWSIAAGIAIGRDLPVEQIADVEPGIAERERKLRRRKPLREFVFEGEFGRPSPLLTD